MRVSSCSPCAARRMHSSFGRAVIQLARHRIAPNHIRTSLAPSQRPLPAAARSLGQVYTFGVKGLLLQQNSYSRSSQPSHTSALGCISATTGSQQQRSVACRPLSAQRSQSVLSSAGTAVVSTGAVGLYTPRRVSANSSMQEIKQQSEAVRPVADESPSSVGVGVDHSVWAAAGPVTAGTAVDCSVAVEPSSSKAAVNDTTADLHVDVSAAAAAAAAQAVPGSSSSSRGGRGRRGRAPTRSRSESRDYVMQLLAKNEAEDAAAAAGLLVSSPAPAVDDAAAKPLPRGNSRRKTPDTPAAAAAAAGPNLITRRSSKRKTPDTPGSAAAAPAADAALLDGLLGMSGAAADVAAVNDDFAAMLAELAAAAAPAAASGGKPPKRGRGASSAAVAADGGVVPNGGVTGAGPAVAAAAAAKPKRGRRIPAAAADLAGVENGVEHSAAAAADNGVLVKSKRGSSRSRSAAAAAAPAGPDDYTDLAAAAAEQLNPTGAVAKPKRGSRKKGAAAAAAAANGTSEGDSDQAAAAAPAPAAKPVRRTKKVIAAEVAEAARLGVFNELTSLAGTYSHVAMFTSSSNGSAWQQLLLEHPVAAAAADGVDAHATALAAAAAAARKGGQLEQLVAGSDVIDHEQQQQSKQQQQQPCVSTSQGTLCRVSGLGSNKQQVWLHNVTHDSLTLSQPTQSYVDWKEEEMQRQDAEAAAAEAAAAAAAEDDQSDEQQQQEGKKKGKRQSKQQTTPQPRKFKRSDSTTPYGQGVLSSQPSSTTAAAAVDLVAAAAADDDDDSQLPFAAATAANGDSLPDAIPNTTPAAAAAGPAAANGNGNGSSSSSSSAREARLLPNLGYACLCMALRQFDVFNSRDCVKKTRDAPDGLAKVSQLALANARDLLPMILWNEAHGIRLFRLSSCILPWMTSYEPEELPDWLDIQKALREAGDAAKRLGHRLTFHPSEYCKIAGEREEWVAQSVKELEVHSRIFDEMGFLPASPYNKINIHVGGTYGGEKEPVLRRFAQVVNERLTPNCKARMTVENDDRANMYSVKDLMLVHELTGIPIVFDFHHWKFCTGGQTQEEAFKLAITTWPKGVRPIVHWSESPEDPDKMRSAHSDYIDGPINLFGLEGEVDVMIESKAKELALLEYRQAVIEGWTIRPKQRNAELAAIAAAAKAEAAAARAEAKEAKLAEKGLLDGSQADAGEEDAGATPKRDAKGSARKGTAKKVNGSTSKSRRKRKSKDSETEESEEAELSDDGDDSE